MRLTTTKKREPELFNGLDNVDENQYFIKIKEQDKVDDFTEVANKLGQLEDIEEELGIDLITLFKALEKGIVVCCNNTFGGERNVFILLTPDRLSIEYKWKCLRKGTQKFYFKDYGKTWALTKEELL